MKNETLFTEYKLGPYKLKNRVVLAPFSRNLATNNVPNDLMVSYYRKRTEAGLIITEGASPSPNGLGYAFIPGCFNIDQIEGWKKITSAVHKKGSKIFLQIMHTGRVSQLLNMKRGSQVLAPSEVTLPGTIWTPEKKELPYSPPKEMSEGDINYTINEFAKTAEYALEADFDGIELHAAHGFLIDQFINTASNLRKDRWGGSPENRIRFALEITKQCCKNIGPEKVGIRLSPYGIYNSMEIDPRIDETYTVLAEKLNDLKICYIHLVDHSPKASTKINLDLRNKIRNIFKGSLILSGGYDKELAERDLKENHADLIAFGRAFMANPNLVTMMKQNKKLRPLDEFAIQMMGEKAYTDYIQNAGHL